MGSNGSVLRMVSWLAIGVLGFPACGSEPAPTEPPKPVVTTVTLDNASLTFDAISATAVLVATVKDQSGTTMPSVSVSWASSNTAVATVTNTGTVRAEGNGRATVTASASGKNASAEVTVAQVIAEIDKLQGDQQTDTVARTLPDSLVAVARDRLGSPVIGMPLPFVPSDGTVEPSPALTDGAGRTAVQWTLGPGAGIQTVGVGPQSIPGFQYFSATALADVPDTLVKVSGDSQIGLPGTLLRQPIGVAVTDRFGNTLPGHTVVFAITSGTGVLDSTVRVTRPFGSTNAAGTAWTLGPELGVQTAEARVDGMKGSPATFRATSTRPTISRIEPDTLREGFGATVFGSGFDGLDLYVVVDGYGGLMVRSQSTDTTLHFEVPSYVCRPARTVSVWLHAEGIPLPDTLQHPLQPTSKVYEWGIPRASIDLDPGERLLIRGVSWWDLEAGRCLQFAPSATGGEEYLIGFGMIAEDPTTTSSWIITSEVGTPAASSPMLQPARSDTRRSIRSRPVPMPDRRRRQLQAEQRIRMLERRISVSASPTRETHALGSQQSVPLSSAQADSTTLTIRVPDLNATDPCATYTEIGATPRYRGSAILVLVDTAYAPPADSLTGLDLATLNGLLVNTVIPIERDYIDTLTDIDRNGRLLLVLSLEVNRLLGGAVTAFSYAGDLRDRAACASSDSAEVVYVQVPDPANLAGTVPRTRASLMQELPAALTHELAHILQYAYRTVRYNETPLSLWEAEGQAALMEEVVGHAVLGNQPYQDYGAGVALDPASGSWYAPHFSDLAAYLGWDGQGGVHLGAPEGCSLFAGPSITGPTPCDPRWFTGTAWSFMRYLSDRLGPSWPGGEAALHRRLLENAMAGTDNISVAMPVGFPELFADWSAALLLDGRAGLDQSKLGFASWDLPDVIDGLGAGAALGVPTWPFEAFADQRQVRDGGTAYLRLTSQGGHPALAVKIRSAAAEGASARGPVFWVVRTR